jgi:hypothetical protein
MQTRATQGPTNSEKQGQNLARTQNLEIVPGAPGRGNQQSGGAASLRGMGLWVR